MKTLNDFSRRYVLVISLDRGKVIRRFHTKMLRKKSFCATPMDSTPDFRDERQPSLNECTTQMHLELSTHNLTLTLNYSP